MNTLVNIAELARIAFGESAEICFYGPRVGSPDHPFDVRKGMAIVCKLRERMPELEARRKLFTSVAANALGMPVRVSVFSGA